jgi:NAD(P)-dependent dehydrogenase (short-subunit alcohol dehydrogenase family)
MDLELSGKVMLVTGGAKGIGAAMVQTFAVEGGKVAVIDRDQKTGVALAESLVFCLD